MEETQRVQRIPKEGQREQGSPKVCYLVLRTSMAPVELIDKVSELESGFDGT
jgi:hypothetical protein